jgi:acetyl esterase
MLDDPTRDLLAGIRALGTVPVYETTPQEARAAMTARQAANAPGPDVPSVTDLGIPSGDGAVLPARVFTPEDPRGVVLYLHGGGWVLGGIQGFDHYGRRLAVALRRSVVLVDYRLAPEHPYPTAADDAFAALRWCADEQVAGRLPAGSLVVFGDSSGGNIAAAAVRRAVDDGVAVAAQLLCYPVLDADFERPSYIDPENQLLVDARAMEWFWDQYLPDPSRRGESIAAPLRGSLAGLPPTIVVTAEHDVLRDEGEEFAERLSAAGVPTVLRRFAGQMHGFATMPVLPASRDLLAFLAESLEPLLSVEDGQRR